MITTSSGLRCVLLALSVLLTPAPLAAQTWSRAPRLATPRMDSAAVVLRDGRVLVVGGVAFLEGRPPGDKARSDGAIAEVWTPGTRRWRRAANLSSGRLGHSATLLSDGRVLVAGGVEASGRHGSAEVWDPSTDRWTSAGAMLVPRTDHTAVCLADGRVLVAGGVHTSNMNDPSGLWTVLAVETAEIWDPATNAWTPAGDHGPRQDPSVTLLADGRVLVAGGAASFSGGTNTASVFDPHTSRWIATHPMIAHVTGHAAARLADGRVLVTGGSLEVEPLGCGPATGGPPCVFVGTSQIWDPRTNRWTRAEAMRVARADHALVALPDGRVAAVGGVDVNRGRGVERSAELYDRSTGRWTLGGPLATARSDFDVVVLPDGRLVVVGGEADTPDVRRRVEIGAP